MNETQEKKAPSSTGTVPGAKDAPTPDRILEWVKKDIECANYCLSFVLRDPEILKRMAQEIFDAAMTKENGSLIDHVRQREE